MKTPPIVACPVCRRRGRWLEAQWKPFCSERCQLVDLGKWFTGSYQISEPLRPDHFEELDQLPHAADPDKPAD